MCRHHNVVGFALDHIDGFTANSACYRQFIYGRHLLAETWRDFRAADQPDVRVLAYGNRDLCGFVTTFFGGHQHFPAGLVWFRVYSQYFWPTNLATIGAVVHTHLRVGGKN